ncbi:MAG: hypothetical protein CSYNP_00983 [Syntrophus sp. SKADARSKE-3]|nr:hypothetical protein [Syntrophus sp. SKADARSKE-3]
MDLGDTVVVDYPRHPFYQRMGKIIGRRGEYAAGDPWFLIYVPSHMRSFLVPQSMLCLRNDINVEVFVDRRE